MSNLRFQVEDCSKGNLTLYKGIKELNNVVGQYCGFNSPPKKFVASSNSLTVDFKKEKGSNARMMASWKKADGNGHRYHIL